MNHQVFEPNVQNNPNHQYLDPNVQNNPNAQKFMNHQYLNLVKQHLNMPNTMLSSLSSAVDRLALQQLQTTAGDELDPLTERGEDSLSRSEQPRKPWKSSSRQSRGVHPGAEMREPLSLLVAASLPV